jgi:hypothetical protein
LESLHVVRFSYFKFENVFVNDSFVGFFVWEGVRDEFNEEDAPSLLLSPIGMDASMSCARSFVRQFLSFVFKQCSLYSCEACDMISIIFVSARSFISVFVMLSGRSMYLLRKLNGSEVASVGW